MYLAGDMYQHGEKGLEQNYSLAFQWFQKAHQHGNFRGTSLVGYYYAYGFGVEKNVHQALLHFGVAAGQGSDAAAYYLGMAHAKGTLGLAVNRDEAMRWLCDCLSTRCQLKQLTPSFLDHAQRTIDALRDGEDEIPDA